MVPSMVQVEGRRAMLLRAVSLFSSRKKFTTPIVLGWKRRITDELRVVEQGQPKVRRTPDIAAILFVRSQRRVS